MADAKKCDRCGAYYQEVKKNYLDSLADALRPITMTQEERKCWTLIESFLDFCPNCTKSFKRWMKGDKQEDV